MPVFELGQVSAVEGSSQNPSFGELIVRRPTAAVALLPSSAVLFTAGAVAGALGRPFFFASSAPPCKVLYSLSIEDAQLTVELTGSVVGSRVPRVLQAMKRLAGTYFEQAWILAGKTLTAPLDRVKLLLQTRGGLQAGALKEAARGGGVVGALVAIGKEEGFMGYWKGNVPQVHSQHGAQAIHSTLQSAF